MNLHNLTKCLFRIQIIRNIRKQQVCSGLAILEECELVIMPIFVKRLLKF